MLNYLNKIVTIVICRPLGSTHPKHNYIYSLNYWYIPNAISGYNKEIADYITSGFEPFKKFN